MTRLGVGLLAWALAGPALAQEAASFREWWAACGEQRDCAAFGFAADGEGGFVRVTRGGAAGATPEVLLAAPAPDAASPPATRTLRVDGMAPMTARLDEAGAYYTATLRDAAARRLLERLRQEQSLKLQLPGSTATVSLDGAAAALRWVDDRQRRADTVTALVAVGAKPAAGVPAPPPRRVVTAAKTVAQGRLPTRFPAAMNSHPALKTCREDEPDRPPDLLAARLGGGRMLWGIGCGHGAYNMLYTLYLGDEAGRGLKPAALAPPSEFNADGNVVVNPVFDAATMRLRAFAKARGMGDCGDYDEWTWDGRALQPTLSKAMGDCRGVPFDYWPELRRAEVR